MNSREVFFHNFISLSKTVLHEINRENWNNFVKYLKSADI